MNHNTPDSGQETFFTEIDGINTRITKIGTGPAVFFLHGWGCSAETMQVLAGGLSSSYTCIFFDFPGFGKTNPPEKAWGIPEYASFTGKLMKSMTDEPAGIVAHSFGGRVVLHMLASSKPEFASMPGRIVITGGAGMKPKRTFTYYRKTFIAKTLKAPLKLLPGGIKKRYEQRMRNSALWQSLGSSEYAQLKGVMQQVFVKTVRDYQGELLPEIEHEVLLIWGEKDDATPLYQAKRMEKGLRNGVLITLNGAGHYAFLDNTSQFRAILASYFKV